ncbi:hypothetical protein Acr_23g0017400 [Actinidia rufa]|uniref:Uncharacterized protein n=1 Tax=Actinidia rufa TaxID=165716 RepID=A0A7J0GRB7_9ERIC|nr:hypothetical protein Acr_23g0017400 [Actinidia rufa]
MTQEAEETTEISPSAEETVLSPIDQDTLTPPTESETMEPKEIAITNEEEKPDKEEIPEAWPVSEETAPATEEGFVGSFIEEDEDDN